MAKHLNNGIHLPEYFEIPEGLEYKYMIWSIAKYYSISPIEAGKMKEIEFWQMTAFENLERAKIKYLAELRSQG